MIYRWRDPFFEGVVREPEPDPLLPVSLGARSYVIEASDYQRSFVADLRDSADQNNEPTEAAFNPQTTWRRGGSSWHMGCGQRDFDLEAQVDQRSRYRSSIGVDPWTRQQAKPLPAFTVRRDNPAPTARHVAAVLATEAGWYATLDGGTYLCPNLGAPTSGPLVTTEVTTKVASHLVQVGTRIYARYTDATLGRIDVGTTVSAAVVPTPVLGTGGYSVIGYAIGRLFVADTDTGTLGELDHDGGVTKVFAHPWGTAGFRWRGFVDTPQGGLAYGDTIDGGTELYRLTTDDTGAVAAPVFAGSLPAAEKVNDMVYVQGTLVFGTTLGLRIATATDTIAYGPLIPIDGGVTHVCVDGRWVLFCWHHYDPESWPDEPTVAEVTYGGFGRLDLSTFTSPLVAAYAPDLMIATDAMPVACGVDTEADEAVVLFDDGDNAARDRSRVPSTPVFITTGRIRYGVYDPKQFTSVDVRTDPLPEGASVAVSAATDAHPTPALAGTLYGFGLSGTVDPFPLSVAPAEWLELRFDLEPTAPPDAGPVLLRWLLRAIPNPRKAEEIVLPLRLFDAVTVDGDAEYSFDVASELKWLREQCRSQTPLPYRDGTEVVSVVINNIQEKATRRTWALDAWQGVVTLQLRTVI